MRLVDIQLSFPAILVALILLAVLGQGVDKIIMALVTVQWAYYARTVRRPRWSSGRRNTSRPRACLALVAPRIVFRHLLPNCLPPLIVVATVQVAHAIALEATLSFLGLGLPITEPSLGLLISNGFQYLLSGKYWISFYPGIALLLTIVAINLVGRPAARRAQPEAASNERQRPARGAKTCSTHFFTKAGVVKAVDDVSFTVERGDILGLVGESGSGKSMTGYSIMGLVDAPGRIVGGRIALEGPGSARRASTSGLRRLRGNRIAMIFQDPMMTLNPVLRIDTQMIEAVHAHHAVVARERAGALRARRSDASASPSPDERLRAYPHQFSGGMRQRVAIAIALLNRPDLIIADEPTTALDVTIQGQILSEVQKLCRERGTALIWITHDLSVVVRPRRRGLRHVRRAHRRARHRRRGARRTRCIPTRTA